MKPGYLFDDFPDLGLIPGSGRSPGEGNGNPLQYSCLENPMDGGAWWATVHGVAESDTTEWLYFHFSSLILTKRKKMRLYLIHCFIYQFSIDKGILFFYLPIFLFSDLSKIFSLFTAILLWITRKFWSLLKDGPLANVIISREAYIISDWTWFIRSFSFPFSHESSASFSSFLLVSI